MEWIPGLRVGPIQFGARPDPIPDSWRELVIRPTDRYAQRGSPSDFASAFRSHYRSHRVDYRFYTIDELQVTVGLEDGQVVSIGCTDSLIYQGVEVIGLEQEDLRELIGVSPIEDATLEFDGSPLILYSAALGADFGILDGRVFSVSCKPIVPPEE